jgi:hypothetical protein
MRRAVFVLSMALLLAAACGSKTADFARRREMDAGPTEPPNTVAPPPRTTARPTVGGAKPRILAKSTSRALSVDAERVYYGDGFEDTLVAVRKEGGDPVRLARRAPVAGALALDGDALAWIAAPGDIVLRVPLRAVANDGGADAGTTVAPGAVLPLREHGLFADVAANGGEIYVAEAQGTGGALTRIIGAGDVDPDAGARMKNALRSTKLATLDAAPRAIVVDATHCYVVTALKVVRTPRMSGALETITIGTDFDSPVLDGDYVYVVAGTGTAGAHDIVRVKKTGSATDTIVKDVRAAPIAIDRGEIFWFDPQRSRLMSLSLAGGTPRIVAQDDALSRPNAIATDADNVYVATGEREDGLVLAIARH